MRKTIIITCLLTFIIVPSWANSYYAEESPEYGNMLEKGTAEAQYNLGMQWKERYDVTNHRELAYKLFEKSATQGYVLAQYELGVCYLRYWGVKRDTKEGVKWLSKAAEQGCTPAMVDLANFYFVFGKPEDKEKAFQLYKEAAEKDNSEGQYWLGLLYGSSHYGINDAKKSFEWIKKSAEQGYIEAQNLLGRCYEKGEGVEKDINEAIKWYERGAAQSAAFVQYEYGSRFLHGDDEMPKDVERYVKWLTKSAEQGYAKAQYNLLAYYVSENKEEAITNAIERLRKTAEHNETWESESVQAQFFMGLCYENGIGIAKNIDEANKWYEKAAKQRHAEASDKINGLQKMQPN